jgi:hypothetical protein
MKRVIAGLPVDTENPSTSFDDKGTEEKQEESATPFKKPILPPITPNNPATA